MSTFDGVVEEFPEIRIDYFRTISGRTPPLATFLSHIHSDHLVGLESLKAPFVYCSSATRELLLRLEKYPHRMNFAKGILETRKQHYRHLQNLLKPIPLNAPTEIELRPGRSIRVTLLDANHCAGAVMFLIEDSTKAILYTGDIRSEPWWVNTLIRNPLMIPYAHGHRKLDKLYLDTTFATKDDFHRSFPTKADGLSELLNKVMKYPKETVFHFHAWTPGYEEVWVALASALNSQIHVDRYKMELYKSLAPTSSSATFMSEGIVLCGFKYGNREQAGCLTSDHTVRLHSCERGTSCPTLEVADVVWIMPIISRSREGVIIPELGVGGGEGDLTQAHELELSDPTAALELTRLCLSHIEDKKAQEKALGFLSSALSSHRKSMSLDALGIGHYEDSIPLVKLTELLAKVTTKEEVLQEQARPQSGFLTVPKTLKARRMYGSSRKLPRSIQFPYSRHSSYDELCFLVEAFKPADIYPCTVDKESWTLDVSIRNLFGHLCSGSDFAHDNEMLRLKGATAASNPLKRRRDKSSLQNYPGSSTEGGVSPDEKRNHNTARTASAISGQVLSNTSVVTESEARPRKRPRANHGRVGISNQCPTPRMTVPSSVVSSEWSPASEQYNGDSTKTTASRPSSTNDLFLINKLNDIRNSFDGWLQSTSSKANPLGQGDASPTVQLMSEMSVWAFAPEPKIEVEPRDYKHDIEPSFRPNNNGPEYPCRWRACNETFGSVSQLRRHVINDHQTIDDCYQSSMYICLWGKCSRSGILAFPTKELWMDHLNTSHCLIGLQAPRSGKKNPEEKPISKSPESQDLSFRSLTDGDQKLEGLSSDRPQGPAGTQADPIALSSQETSSSTVALFDTEDPDDHESSPNNATTQESQESHLSLSTSAFESQSSSHLNPKHQAKDLHAKTERSTNKLRHRKEAYRAARRTRGLGWAEMELVSSSGGHGELEEEL